MHPSLLVAGFAAVAAAGPVAQAIDFAAVAAATSPSLTQPPVASVTQIVSYNSASVASVGSAAVTGIASASATASQLNKRFIWNFGWGFGSSTKTTSSSSCTTTSSTSSTSSKYTSSSIAPTTTSISVTTTSSTTSSTSACPTTPEAGTYCGFINPEDPCAVQPDGYGPKVTPDTVAAFEAYQPFHDMALNAETPSGYAATFRDLNASVSANTYLGLITLSTYDTLGCSQWCDNTTTCTAFNIYVERDPSLNPSTNCTDPSSITNYKCTLWGSGVDSASANNYGQYRDDFQVVISGSDGFAKSNNTTPPSCSGWKAPQPCSGLHNHPSTCLGSKFFPGPYDPNLCASYAAAQNAINTTSSWWNFLLSIFNLYNPLKCNFFNSYMLKKNGRPLGTYCSLYAQQYQPSQATYFPGWQGSDFWGFETSWSYCSN